MTAIERTVTEVMAEHGIPKDQEGMVKYFADQFERLEKSLGAPAAEAKARADAAAAEVLNKAPEGRMERTVTGKAALAREKALISEYMRHTKFKNVEGIKHLRPREEVEREINAIVRAGGFEAAVAYAVERDPSFDVKTLTTTSDTALIATMFEREFVAKRILLSEFREKARVVPMGGPIVKFPRITTESAAVVHAQDTNDASSTNDIDTDQITLTASELITKVKVANETIRDQHVNVMDMIQFSLGRKLLQTADTYYATGTGTGQPEGFTTGSFSKTVPVGGTLSWLHIVDAINQLGNEYTRDARASGLCIIGNQNGQRVVMRLRDQEERPILQFTQTERGPMATFWGLPFVVLPGITGGATAGSSTKLYVAALNDAYMIGDRQNAEMFVSTERYAEERSTLVGLTMSHDGRIALTDAVCELSGVEE